ncbi:MAG: histidine ammonia-lyase [Desulfobacteraceae bacterium 4572_35.2]|nr:MAG: histidine ammonia-lyase [Desulfobacteraceae bacterium 4572_35.2]
MSTKKTVVLTGCDLTVEQIIAVGVGDLNVALDEQALQRCRESREFLENAVEQKHVIYGVNTSFGPMCNKIIDNNSLKALQVNLIRSHAAGLGDPLKPYVAQAVMLIRLNTLVKGYSGVRFELLEFMQWMINNDIAAYIPECGSVGASGDLIHLAHLGLGIIGEGNVYYQDQLRPAAEVFAELGRKPIRLSYKEGIALMNGTSAMTALAAFAIYGAKKLLRVSYVTGAFGIELFGGIDDAFDVDLHDVKPHPGQLETAQTIRNLYQGSTNITRREDMHDQIREQHQDGLVFETTINVQDVYSIRCTPQVLAPVTEMIAAATRTVEIEANSSNDNPIIIPKKKKIIHGGNFHGQSIGFAFMGAQYLATSTTAENRQLANPVSTNSISCNASNQDVVSMGTIAARKAFRLVSNAKHILTMEVLADLQALSFRNAAGLGGGTAKIYALLNKDFEVYDNNRVFHDDLVKLRKTLFSSQIFDDLTQYWQTR